MTKRAQSMRWCDCISGSFTRIASAIDINVIDFFRGSVLHAQHDAKLKMEQKIENYFWVICRNAAIANEVRRIIVFFFLLVPCTERRVVNSWLLQARVTTTKKYNAQADRSSLAISIDTKISISILQKQEKCILVVSAADGAECL